MTADGKVERHHRKPRCVVTPELGADTWLARFDRFAKHFVDSLAARMIRQVRQGLGRDQHDPGIIAANTVVCFEKADEILGQGTQREVDGRFEIGKRAATGSPTATGEHVLLAIKRQVIKVLPGHDFHGNRRVIAVTFDQAGGTLRAADALSFIAPMSVFGALVQSHLELGTNPLKRFDFVIADQLEAFALLWREVNGLLDARQVLREFAVAVARPFGFLFAFFFFGRVDDLLGFADRFFQSTDDFGRGFFGQVKKQLAFAINAALTSAAKQLTKELFYFQCQLDVLFFELIVVGFELEYRVGLFFGELVFERNRGFLLRKRGGLLLNLRLQSRDQTVTVLEVTGERVV